jgi:hypothetical protein
MLLLTDGNPVLRPKKPAGSRGPNMSKTTFIAIAILTSSIGYAEAKDKNLPVCTASSSLFKVLGHKCVLVKGSMIYGDIAELSQIIHLGW